ncbi:cyclin-J18-like [Amaranthus tricolor]|uniref:cyclin-J18-like n=1 Tax=Amaranthus tricolor TaxID=29722 RepID=UPI00258C69BD|nr:cyclin-J18-like [Amaranthus tricolor]XP_057515967.1 cyclin-J18-like [Amaranthus tricolor]
MKNKPEFQICPPLTLRLDALNFLIKSAEKLKLSQAVKYASLSLFAHRFFVSLTSSTHRHWLLEKPIKFPNLQLFSLVSLWISSKTYDSPPISLKSLKSISDQLIKDQHFTKSDFLDAEVVFLQTLNFEVGTLKNSAFLVVQELLMKLKEVARVGDLVSFDACCDVMDLIYVNDEISRLFEESPVYSAAAILSSVYAITVPKQTCEFPVVSWMNFVTGCKEEDLMLIVKLIFHHVFQKF